MPIHQAKRRVVVGSRALRITMLALLTSMAHSAFAVELETGNPDVQLRLDNTIRYNLGMRTQGQSASILKNPNFDDGDRNFDKNSIVNNRVDVLTEFDFVYKQAYGVHVSAATWYDAAYSGSLDNTSRATSNHVVNGVPSYGFSDYTSRYYKGPSGEWMDAYAFGRFMIGDSSLTVRAGRHTVNWGESLLGGGAINGIAYGQAPLDQGKALALPGVEAKELYLPRGQLSMQWQATPELAFGGQYFYEWRPSRLPEGGTYLGFGDFYQQGANSLINPALPGGRAYHGTDITPSDSGDWGVMSRWSPQWLDGTLGFYVRNFSDTLPQVALLAGRPSHYFLTYGSDIDLYGISLSKQVSGVSLGVDVDYRHNMPLVSNTALVTSASRLPEEGETLGARGNTAHAVFNAIGTLNSTPLYNSASWAAELTWSHWASVTSDPLKLFKGYASYAAVSTNIDAVSRNAYTLALNFTPTWYQVFPGADLSMPLSYSVGLSGNSPVQSGGNKDAGSFGVGLGLDVHSRYKFNLQYVGYFGNDATNAAGVVVTPSGAQALLKDRGAVFFTFKTTL